MNIFKRIWNSVKQSILRFPAVTILSIVASVAFSLQIYRGDLLSVFLYKQNRSVFVALGMSAVWTLVFSVVMQLVLEIATTRNGSTKIRSVVFSLCQALCVAMIVPGFLLCLNESEYVLMSYWGTLVALMVLCPLLLSFFEKKENVVPKIICAIFYAGVIAFCVSAGCTIIFWAFTSLIHEFRKADEIYNVIIICTQLFFFANCFIAFATKRDEPFTEPKFLRIVIEYVLFPLYVALVVVLYAYLIKCSVTKSLPVGMINWFVSFATIFYFLFYFSLQNETNKAARFFYRAGSFFMMPLILVQLIVFFIRVHEYGFTPVRWASVVYILFSIWFVTLSLVKEGKYMMLSFAVAAIFSLLATCTPFNVLDVSARSQSVRLVEALKQNGLFVDNKIVPAKNSSSISKRDKAINVSAYDALSQNEKKPDWFPEQKKKYSSSLFFEEKFGFAYGTHYADENFTEKEIERCFIKAKDIYPVEGYKKLYIIGYQKDAEAKNDGKSIWVKCNGKKYDISAELEPYFKDFNRLDSEEKEPVYQEPLVLKKDGMCFMFSNIEIRRYKESKSIFSFSLAGCALEK